MVFLFSILCMCIFSFKFAPRDLAYTVKDKLIKITHNVGYFFHSFIH